MKLTKLWNNTALCTEKYLTLLAKVLITLGTHAINHLVQAVKKSKYDTAPPEWQFCKARCEIANQVHMRNATVMPDMAFLTNTQTDPSDLDKQVVMVSHLIPAD